MDQSLSEYIADASVNYEKQKASQQKMSTTSQHFVCTAKHFEDDDECKQLSNAIPSFETINLDVDDDDIKEDINEMYQQLNECKAKCVAVKPNKRELIMPPEPEHCSVQQNSNNNQSNNNNLHNKNNIAQTHNNNNNKPNNNNNTRFQPYPQQQRNNFNNNQQQQQQQRERQYSQHSDSTENVYNTNLNNLSQMLLSNLQQQFQLQQRQNMFNNINGNNINSNGIGQFTTTLPNFNNMNAFAGDGLFAGQQIIRSINLVQLSNGCWYIGQNGVYTQTTFDMNALNFPYFVNGNNNSLLPISSNLNRGASIPIQNLFGLNNGVKLLLLNNNAQHSMNNTMSVPTVVQQSTTAATNNLIENRPQRRSIGSLLGQRPNNEISPDLIDLALSLISNRGNNNNNGNN